MMATERWNDEEEKDFHSLENQGFARNMEPHHLSLLMLIPPIVKNKITVRSRSNESTYNEIFLIK